jgi:hypothetical protein
MSIRVRESGLARGVVDTEVVEFPLNRDQALADLGERACRPELTEKHGHELLPTGEPSSMTLGASRCHCLLKDTARKELEKLTENAGECVQRRASCRSFFFAESDSTVSGVVFPFTSSRS